MSERQPGRRWPVWAAFLITGAIFVYMVLLGGGTMLLGFWPAFRSGARPLRRPGTGAAVVRSLAFAPGAGDPVLAAASEDGAVRLWRAADGALLQTLGGEGRGVLSLAFAPGADGQLLAAAAADGRVDLWRRADGALLRTLAQPGPVLSLAFDAAPGGDTLAAGGGDGAVRLWRAGDGELLRTLPGHSDWVSSLAFAPDGARLASGSHDGAVRLWRPAEGRLERLLAGDGAAVLGLAFAPDGSSLAVASFAGTVRLWDPAGGQLRRELDLGAPVWAVIFTPDGGGLVTATDDGWQLWPLASGATQPALRVSAPGGRSLAVSPSGSLLAAGSTDGRVRLWQLGDGILLRTLEPGGGDE